MKKPMLPILALLATSIIWGVAGPVIKFTLPFVPPMSFLFFRFLLASFFIFPFFARQEKVKPLHEKDLPRLFFLGLFGMTINLSLIFYGFERTSAIEGSFLTATTPILITLAGWFILKEKITPKERAGTLLAFLGTLLIVFLPAVTANNKPGLETVHLEGNFLILLANLAWVVYTIYSKELCRKYSSLTLTATSFFVGLFTFTPLAAAEVFLFNRVPVLNTAALLGLLYMSFLSLLAAYFLYEWGLRRLEASEAGVFAYLQPIFALPAAFFLLGETLNFKLLPGIILAAVGVTLATSEKIPLRRR